MVVGVLRETKKNEYRVSMTPDGVNTLIKNGHRVLVQKDAGFEVGMLDDEYRATGAEIIKGVEDIFASSDLIVKIKEPTIRECKLLRPNQTIFSYLHLVAFPKQTKLLLDSKATAIAYETITDDNNKLPILAPMSEIAGKMAVQIGARLLEKTYKGIGVLLGGATGVEPQSVLVIGGGVVGINAAKIAHGMGAKVVILDNYIPTLKNIDLIFNKNVTALYLTKSILKEYLYKSDLIIGATLIHGARANKIITRKNIENMKRGSVIVDVSIDQGGIFETSKPTTYKKPVYEVDGIRHCCITNIPAAVAKTATLALTNVTLEYILNLANSGYSKAIRDKNFQNGVNIHKGKIIHKNVADFFKSLEH